MENKIPLPTDNIFKFYALFGLLLFVFGAGSFIYIQRTTNDLAFQTRVDVEIIKQIAKPSEVDLAKKAMLEKRLEIAAADKDFYLKVIGGIIGVGILAMFYGFGTWHNKVQPIQDEILKLQLEKLRHEVKQLKKPHPSSPSPASTSPQEVTPAESED